MTGSSKAAGTFVAAADLAPPRSEVGIIGWLSKNLFSSWSNSLITLVSLWVTWRVVMAVLDWAVFSAVWTGNDGSVCQSASVGACWPFVTAKFGQFMYGRYPDSERWRVMLTYGLTAMTLAALMIPAIPWKKWFGLFAILGLPFISWALLYGGVFGLSVVKTEFWGGLLVTLVVATVGIAGSFPIGIILALGRRSEMPVARWVSIFFIEVVRAVPLITILFMSSVMLPLFLPDGVSFDKLLRALIGVMLFSGAYMAETIRGGLQAIPRGQYEAADSLGLSFAQKMGFIVLPQALKLVIPGIVNSFVGLAKDTSLVLIIGIFDLLGVVQAGLTDAKWFAPGTAMTGYVFAAFVFWVICFSISRYSAWLEKRLSVGDRR